MEIIKPNLVCEGRNCIPISQSATNIKRPNFPTCKAINTTKKKGEEEYDQSSKVQLMMKGEAELSGKVTHISLTFLSSPMKGAYIYLDKNYSPPSHLVFTFTSSKGEKLSKKYEFPEFKLCNWYFLPIDLPDVVLCEITGKGREEECFEFISLVFFREETLEETRDRQAKEKPLFVRKLLKEDGEATPIPQDEIKLTDPILIHIGDMDCCPIPRDSSNIKMPHYITAKNETREESDEEFYQTSNAQAMMNEGNHHGDFTDISFTFLESTPIKGAYICIETKWPDYPYASFLTFSFTSSKGERKFKSYKFPKLKISSWFFLPIDLSDVVGCRITGKGRGGENPDNLFTIATLVCFQEETQDEIRIREAKDADRKKFWSEAAVKKAEFIQQGDDDFVLIPYDHRAIVKPSFGSIQGKNDSVCKESRDYDQSSTAQEVFRGKRSLFHGLSISHLSIPFASPSPVVGVFICVPESWFMSSPSLLFSFTDSDGNDTYMKYEFTEPKDEHKYEWFFLPVDLDNVASCEIEGKGTWKWKNNEHKYEWFFLPVDLDNVASCEIEGKGTWKWKNSRCFNISSLFFLKHQVLLGKIKPKLSGSFSCIPIPRKETDEYFAGKKQQIYLEELWFKFPPVIAMPVTKEIVDSLDDSSIINPSFSDVTCKNDVCCKESDYDQGLRAQKMLKGEGDVSLSHLSIPFPSPSPMKGAYICVHKLYSSPFLLFTFTDCDGKKTSKKYEFTCPKHQYEWQFLPIDLDNIVLCEIEGKGRWCNKNSRYFWIFSLAFIRGDESAFPLLELEFDDLILLIDNIKTTFSLPSLVSLFNENHTKLKETMNCIFSLKDNRLSLVFECLSLFTDRFIQSTQEIIKTIPLTLKNDKQIVELFADEQDSESSEQEISQQPTKVSLDKEKNEINSSLQYERLFSIVVLGFDLIFSDLQSRISLIAQHYAFLERFFSIVFQLSETIASRLLHDFIKSKSKIFSHVMIRVSNAPESERAPHVQHVLNLLNNILPQFEEEIKQSILNEIAKQPSWIQNKSFFDIRLSILNVVLLKDDNSPDQARIKDLWKCILDQNIKNLLIPEFTEDSCIVINRLKLMISLCSAAHHELNIFLTVKKHLLDWFSLLQGSESITYWAKLISLFSSNSSIVERNFPKDRYSMEMLWCINNEYISLQDYCQYVADCFPELKMWTDMILKIWDSSSLESTSKLFDEFLGKIIGPLSCFTDVSSLKQHVNCHLLILIFRSFPLFIEHNSPSNSLIALDESNLRKFLKITQSALIESKKDDSKVRELSLLNILMNIETNIRESKSLEVDLLNSLQRSILPIIKALLNSKIPFDSHYNLSTILKLISNVFQKSIDSIDLSLVKLVLQVLQVLFSKDIKPKDGKSEVNTLRDSVLSTILPCIMPWMEKYPEEQILKHWISILNKLALDDDDYRFHKVRSSKLRKYFKKIETSLKQSESKISSVLKGPTLLAFTNALTNYTYNYLDMDMYSENNPLFQSNSFYSSIYPQNSVTLISHFMDLSKFQPLSDSSVEAILKRCKILSVTKSDSSKNSLLVILLPNVLPWMDKYPNDKFFGYWMDILMNLSLNKYNTMPHRGRSSKLWELFHPILCIVKNNLGNTLLKNGGSCLGLFANLCCNVKHARDIQDNLKEHISEWCLAIQTQDNIKTERHLHWLNHMLSSASMDQTIPSDFIQWCCPLNISGLIGLKKSILETTSPDELSKLFEKYFPPILCIFEIFSPFASLHHYQSMFTHMFECLSLFSRHTSPSGEVIILPKESLEDLIRSLSFSMNYVVSCANKIEIHKLRSQHDFEEEEEELQETLMEQSVEEEEEEEEEQFSQMIGDDLWISKTKESEEKEKEEEEEEEEEGGEGESEEEEEKEKEKEKEEEEEKDKEEDLIQQLIGDNFQHDFEEEEEELQETLMEQSVEEEEEEEEEQFSQMIGDDLWISKTKESEEKEKEEEEEEEEEGGEGESEEEEEKEKEKEKEEEEEKDKEEDLIQQLIGDNLWMRKTEESEESEEEETETGKNFFSSYLTIINSGFQKGVSSPSILCPATSTLHQLFELSELQDSDDKQIEEMISICSQLALRKEEDDKDRLVRIILPHVIRLMKKYPKFLKDWGKILSSLTLDADNILPHTGRSAKIFQVFFRISSDGAITPIKTTSVFEVCKHHLVSNGLAEWLSFFANLCYNSPDQASQIYENIKEYLGSWYDQIKANHSEQGEQKEQSDNRIRSWVKLIAMLSTVPALKNGEVFSPALTVAKMKTTLLISMLNIEIISGKSCPKIQ
ncbi:Small heat shock protein RTM2-like protein [Aduncisulcus paluster]|uniref:Small heat shock protein RTM2-like protein n=1 Tax=Aduncisulcus paluster TaxID=2918883 RepID=A0ABQ5JX81_9EUKA|nr:Small heat shock protein RTM2-like protein [Aduncisulcus paluster]